MNRHVRIFRLDPAGRVHYVRQIDPGSISIAPPLFADESFYEDAVSAIFKEHLPRHRSGKFVVVAEDGSYAWIRFVDVTLPPAAKPTIEFQIVSV